MFRTSSRIAAAAALLFATVAIATVASTSTAGAANTNVTADCSTSGSIQSINNSDTLTITVGAGCGAVVVMDIAGGTAEWVPTFPLTQGSPIGGLSQGNTIIYTAPASGSGSAAIGFMATAQDRPAITFTINFPMPSGSLTDNGNGTMTVTYSGSIIGFLLPSGSVCAASLTVGPSNYNYILAPDAPPGGQLAASPAVIAVGTPLMAAGPTPVPVTAGNYQACLYEGVGPGGPLLSSLAVAIGTVTPTTAPSGDPVAPAFTG